MTEKKTAGDKHLTENKMLALFERHADEINSF